MVDLDCKAQYDLVTNMFFVLMMHYYLVGTLLPWWQSTS